MTDGDLDASTDYEKNVIEAEVPRRELLECYACGRLHVEKFPGANDFLSFSPDGERLDLPNRVSGKGAPG